MLEARDCCLAEEFLDRGSGRNLWASAILFMTYKVSDIWYYFLWDQDFALNLLLQLAAAVTILQRYEGVCKFRSSYSLKSWSTREMGSRRRKKGKSGPEAHEQKNCDCPFILLAVQLLCLQSWSQFCKKRPRFIKPFNKHLQRKPPRPSICVVTAEASKRCHRLIDHF